jgi:hypothetical protein
LTPELEGELVICATDDWDEIECAFTCKDELSNGLVFGWFNPYGVAVNMVKDQLISIALAG